MNERRISHSFKMQRQAYESPCFYDFKPVVGESLGEFPWNKNIYVSIFIKRSSVLRSSSVCCAIPPTCKWLSYVLSIVSDDDDDRG